MVEFKDISIDVVNKLTDNGEYHLYHLIVIS